MNKKRISLLVFLAIILFTVVLMPTNVMAAQQLNLKIGSWFYEKDTYTMGYDVNLYYSFFNKDNVIDKIKSIMNKAKEIIVIIRSQGELMNYKLPTKAIITDAGFASRFLPITKTIPKAMIPIGSKPVMQLCVEECAAAGIEEIIIVATPHTKSKEIYEDYFNNKSENVRNLLEKQGKLDRFESVEKVINLPKITVIEQDDTLPYGNGSPIVSAKDFINDDESFVVLYSDDLILGKSDIATLVETYKEHPDAKAVIAAQEMPKEVWNRYGMIALKENGTLSHIVEKPKTPDLSPSNLTSYGRYLLTPEVFNYLVPENTGLDNELWTVDAITKLAETGDVIVARSAGKWITTGDPKNYALASLSYTLLNEPYAEELREFIKNN